MNTDEIMRKATEHFDQIIVDALEDAAAMIRACDSPTPDEFADFMVWYRQELAADRVRNLARLRSWLARDGRELH